MEICDKNFGLLAVFASESYVVIAVGSRYSDIVCGNIAYVFSYHGNYCVGKDPKSYYLNPFISLMRHIF